MCVQRTIWTLLLISLAQAGMQRPQCLGRLSDSSDQPIILLPDSGLVGWSWQMDIENVTTSFEVAGVSAQ